MKPGSIKPEVQSIDFKSRQSTVSLTGVFVVLAAIGNSAMACVLWNNGKPLFTSFFCGVLLAQPCLLFVWCSSVNQRLISRVSSSLGILAILFCLYVVTLRALADMPLEVPFVFLGILIALGMMIQLPLGAMRRYTRAAISIGRSRPTTNFDSQFGIKHLMIATTIVAIGLVLAQATFANMGFEGGTAPWPDILTFLGTLAILTAAVCLLSVVFVFEDRIRIVAGIMLLLTVFVGPAVVSWVLANASRSFQKPNDEVYFNTLAYAFALAGTINIILLCYYSLGYRMQSTHWNQPFDPKSDSSLDVRGT